MDAPGFDRLARRFTARFDRRRGLGLLASLGLARLGIAPGAEGKKKKKKACPPCRKRKKGKCKGTQADGTACAGGTCQGGSCIAGTTCGSGQKACNGGCIPSNQCCIDTDCAPDAPRCCRGTCFPSSRCCTDTDCESGALCLDGACKTTPPCEGLADDAPCNGDGRCLNGVCNPRPDCDIRGTSCSPVGPNSACCSDVCYSSLWDPAYCDWGSHGARCLADDQCFSQFQCVGYRCT